MDILRRRSIGNISRAVCRLTLAAAIALALVAPTQAQTGLFRTDDYLSITRGSTIRWSLRYDRLVDSLRNLSLFVTLDVLSDSLDLIPRTQGGAGGRTYFADKRSTIHAGLGNLDSSGALYIMEFNFGTLNYQGYANFSNNIGASWADSTHFQFNGLAPYGFMLPTDNAYPVTFERMVLKTNYGGSTDAPYVLTFPQNITSSSDSSLFSVHLKTEYVASTRYYYVRVYKHAGSSVTGLAVPLATGTLVCSHSIPSDRFPLYGTSVQIRIDMWIRRL